MRPGSLRSVPIAAPSVQGKPCKARNGRWTGRPHRESPRASVSASPVIIYYNACLKTQSDRLLDWSDIDPSIFGTLFERGLDPDKRSQLGAHYTDRDKIMLIVEPVILRPLTREWEEAKQAIQALLKRAGGAKSTSTATKARKEAQSCHTAF